MININLIKNTWIYGLLITTSLILSGCYSFQGASIPPDVTSYSVGFFENNTPMVNPKLSQIITEKLKDKMNTTRLNFAREKGDFSFKGSIIGYAIIPIAVKENATATQNRLTITLSIKFECIKHPKNNFEQTFSNFQDFDANKNFSSLENNLVSEITDQLIQEIFNKAAVNW